MSAALARNAVCARRTTSRRGSVVRVMAKGDGKRVERSNKRDVM